MPWKSRVVLTWMISATFDVDVVVAVVFFKFAVGTYCQIKQLVSKE
jgi:hypothetical protein